MFHSIRNAFLVLFAATLLPALSHAHFVWVTVRGSEGDQIHLQFSEARFDPTMDMLMGRLDEIARGGSFEGLAFQPDATGLVATSKAGTRVATAKLTYGLFGRGGGAPLLIYHAKGARDLEAAGQAAGLDVEVLAAAEADGWRLTVLHKGQPVPDAQVVVVDAGQPFEEEFTTGEDGTAVVPTPRSSIFYLRALVETPGTGDFNGEAYDRVLNYATLTVERTREVDFGAGDVEACLLLEAADVRRVTVPADIAAFRGDFTTNVGGTRRSGEFVLLGGALEHLAVEGAEPSDLHWLRAGIQEAFRPLMPMAHDTSATIVRDREAEIGGSAHLTLGGGRSLILRNHQIEELRGFGIAGQVRSVLAWDTSSEGLLLPTAEVVGQVSEEGDMLLDHTVMREFTMVEDVTIPAVYRERLIGPQSARETQIEFGLVDFVRATR